MNLKKNQQTSNCVEFGKNNKQANIKLCINKLIFDLVVHEEAWHCYTFINCVFIFHL